LPQLVRAAVDVPLPEGGLAPGQSLNLLCWLQPRVAGSKVIQLGVGYHAQTNDPKLAFRVSKQSALLDVQPGVRVAASLYADPFELDRAYLALRCRCASLANVHLGRLELVSTDWQLSSPGQTPLSSLTQGQHRVTTFPLQRQPSDGSSSQLQLHADASWSSSDAVYNLFASERSSGLSTTRQSHVVSLHCAFYCPFFTLSLGATLLGRAWLERDGSASPSTRCMSDAITNR
jgi:hypothetical protein